MRGVLEGARSVVALLVEIESAPVVADVDVAGGRIFAAGAMVLGSRKDMVKNKGVVVAEVLRLHCNMCFVLCFSGMK